MDKQTFMAAMQPALTYYSRKSDPELLDLYFDELGGYPANKLERAVKNHVAVSRFFPKIPELRKAITGKEGSEEKPRATMDREMLRNYEICERLFDDPAYQHEPTTYPVHKIVDAARLAYRDGIENHGSEKKKERRYVSSAMWEWNLRAFQGERFA